MNSILSIYLIFSHILHTDLNRDFFFLANKKFGKFGKQTKFNIQHSNIVTVKLADEMSRTKLISDFFGRQCFVVYIIRFAYQLHELG